MTYFLPNWPCRYGYSCWMIRIVVIGMSDDGPNAVLNSSQSIHMYLSYKTGALIIYESLQFVCGRDFSKYCMTTIHHAKDMETCIDHTVATSDSHASRQFMFWWQRKNYLWESVAFALLVSTSNLFYLDSLILSLFGKRLNLLRSTPYLCHCTPTCSKPTHVIIKQWLSGLI